MTNKHESDAEPVKQAWQEHNLEQLRYFRSLSLRTKLEAIQGMADITRRFQQMRVTGRFRDASKTKQAK